MNILLTGKGKSGSWKIRGEQLGAAIGQTVIAQASEASIRASDAVVLVKRPFDSIVAECHRLNKPIIWDVVDSWPQPYGNLWDRSMCIHWAQDMVKQINPAAIIAATRKMASDFMDFVKVPVKWIPHHGRPGIAINPIREQIAVVGYEGGENYVSQWGRIIQQQCRDRGWLFSCASGPDALASFDIVVALRDPDVHGGYAPRHWKSNVKLANAHASGTPFVGNRESGYLETMCGAEYWADNKYQLSMAFDWLERQDTRQKVHREFIHSAISLESVASEYSSWIRQLRL